MALDKNITEEFEDQTKPNFAKMTKRAGAQLDAFRDFIFPAGYDTGSATKKRTSGGSAAKKPKPDVDLETEAKSGRLEKLTVAALKELASENKINLKATKKADIIAQIKKHFRV
uniref:Ku70/Ku80 C-terminal arm domain-containing protein n=2 Tax=Plectus sambesii TaxID=2011161 RepID=A0A914V382_9BILA